MGKSSHANSRARRQALQALYINEICGKRPVAFDRGAHVQPSSDSDEETDGIYPPEELFISQLPKGADEFELVSEDAVAYTAVLIDGVLAYKSQIDAWISATAQNWTLDRMPIVDRNIIRIATYEIAYEDEIPTGVAINEAVEVAKAFGTKESPKFVNGVLGRIAEALASGEAMDMDQADKTDVTACVFDTDSNEGAGNV